MTSTELNPVLEPIAFLVGSWRGEGRGFYPTIEGFAYVEESRFWTTGRAVMHYEQLTNHPETGAPMHCETGYLRVNGDDVELVLAHPLGVIEVEEGTVSGTRLELASTTTGSSSTAMAIGSLTRTIEVEGSELTYTLSMEAVGEPLQGHLEATLRRVSEP